jgi:peroxiredoxin
MYYQSGNNRPLRALLVIAFLMAVSSLSAAAGLTDMDGKPTSLEDFTGKGKWTVVMVWASDCLVCNTEAHEYVDLQTRRPDIQMLGLTLDGEANKADALAFIKEHKLNFPNLIGEPETIAGLYYDLTGGFFAGTPTFLVFSPQGTLTAADAGAIPPRLIEEFIENNALASNE